MEDTINAIIVTDGKTQVKETAAKKVEKFAVQNGYVSNEFESKTLNKLTKDFYTAMAKGSLALWDVAETLSEISESIERGEFAETDPEITTFSDYCNKLGFDRSNYAKYVRAWKRYSALKYAGFTIGIAVALLPMDITADEFLEKYTPLDISVRDIRAMIKEQKMLETEQEEEEQEEKQTETEQEEEEQPKTSEENVAEDDTLRYVFSADSLNDLISNLVEYINLTHTDDITNIKEYDKIYDIIQRARV